MRVPEDLGAFYERQLLEQVLPFWLRHAPDSECGGYFTCLDRDGSVYDPGKLCLWAQGRLAWTFAWLYNRWRPEPVWLDFARRGVEFLVEHGFSPSGRMYYATYRDGTPMLPGQDYHVELSTVLAFNEVARAVGDAALRRRARALVRNFFWCSRLVPGSGKIDTGERAFVRPVPPRVGDCQGG